MRKALAVLIVAALVALAVPAFAELQNVIVGGSIGIRGNYYDSYSTLALGGCDMDKIVKVRNNSDAFVEMRTRLNVKADFTDNVSAFIELDDYSLWGEDFRSNYLTGVDSRAASGAAVNLYQAYIETSEMWGTGLKAKIGRQELVLGSGFLVSNNDKGPFAAGLSFDGVRVSYVTDQFSADAIWAKLVERSPIQEDGDTDLYGVYLSYKGVENMTFDAYWLFVRDATNFAGSLDTHTVGLRGAGKAGALDFEAEVAYQWLDLDYFKSSDAFAGNLEVGYTFDMNFKPRVFVGGAAFGASDKDLPFDRLFSGWKYSKFFQGNLGSEAANANLSNFWTARGGIQAEPTESIKVQLSGGYLGLVQDFGGPSDLGGELDASVTYNYSQDLAFEVGYAHFFSGDASGLPDDLNYGYFQTKLSF